MNIEKVFNKILSQFLPLEDWVVTLVMLLPVCPPWCRRLSCPVLQPSRLPGRPPVGGPRRAARAEHLLQDPDEGQLEVPVGHGIDHGVQGGVEVADPEEGDHHGVGAGAGRPAHCGRQVPGQQAVGVGGMREGVEVKRRERAEGVTRGRREASTGGRLPSRHQGSRTPCAPFARMSSPSSSP